MTSNNMPPPTLQSFVPVKREFTIKDSWKFMPMSAEYPWTPAEFVDFFGRKAGVEGVEAPVPAFWEDPEFVRTAVTFTLVGGGAGFLVLYLELYRSKWLYMVGCLFVFWLSTSGVMYTFLRGVPWYGVDKEGHLVLFNAGGGRRGQSLGFEGLIMGASYVAFSTVVVLFTWGLPRLKNSVARRFAGYALLLAIIFMSDLIFRVFKRKTGYEFRSYWT